MLQFCLSVRIGLFLFFSAADVSHLLLLVQESEVVDASLLRVYFSLSLSLCVCVWVGVGGWVCFPFLSHSYSALALLAFF